MNSIRIYIQMYIKTPQRPSVNAANSRTQNHSSSSSSSAGSGRDFLLALDIPLPPASSSSSTTWGLRFSFSGFLGGPPKKSPMPFCQVGVGRGHTGLPPAYLFFAGVEHWLLEEEAELAELEPRDFLGAAAATAFLYVAGTLSALVLTI